MCAPIDLARSRAISRAKQQMNRDDANCAGDSPFSVQRIITTSCENTHDAKSPFASRCVPVVHSIGCVVTPTRQIQRALHRARLKKRVTPPIHRELVV